MQDWQLLQEFVKNDSQAAFSRLVERNLNLVYSTCLREIGDPGLAEDATQVVFLLLAQKAKSLRAETVLTGWLFQTARFVAKNARKQEIRWRQRTDQATEVMMLEAERRSSTEENLWTEVQLLLHDAMDTLSTPERNAVLLRCFEERSLKETGEVLGVTEEAARKRVTRALEKLRSYFTRHGVTLSVATLAGLLTANAVQAAPSGLAATTSAVFSTTAPTATAGSIVTGGFGTKTMALAQSVKHAWLLAKIKLAATAVCSVFLVTIGAKELVGRTNHVRPTAASTNQLTRRLQVQTTGTQEQVRSLPAAPTRIVRSSPDLTSRVTTATNKPQRVRSAIQPVGNVFKANAKANASGFTPHQQAKPIASKLIVTKPVVPNPIVNLAQNVESAPVTAKQNLPAIEAPGESATDSPKNITLAEDTTRDKPISSHITQRREDMQIKKTVVSALIGTAIAGSALVPQAGLTAEVDKGTLTGLLTAKGENWIEVKADDAKEAKRYIPNWNGGMPKDGGGLDKETLASIKKLRVPNRVRLNWAFNEHLRIISVELLEPKDKTGVVEGEVVAKGENWVEVKAGNGPVERYSPRWVGGLPKDGGGLDKDALRAIGEVKVGDKVRLEWSYEERLRIVSLKKQ